MQQKRKPRLQKVFQDATSTVDATGLCQFLTFGVGLEEMLPQLSAATGVPYTLEGLMQIGERIWNLERLWNERAGFTGKDDYPAQADSGRAHPVRPGQGRGQPPG